MLLSGGACSVLCHFFDKAISCNLHPEPYNLPELDIVKAGLQEARQRYAPQAKRRKVSCTLARSQPARYEDGIANPVGQSPPGALGHGSSIVVDAHTLSGSEADGADEVHVEPHVARSVVHRVCVHLPTTLGNTAKHSLLSWSYGYRQFIWTYEVSIAWLAPGCEIRDLSLLLPRDELWRLTAQGAHIKDIEKWLALQVLLECGGVYVAMDVLWLGQQLPRCEGKYREMWVAPRDGAGTLKVTPGPAWAATRWSMARLGAEAGCTSLPQMLSCFCYSLVSNPGRGSHCKFTQIYTPSSPTSCCTT